MVYFAFRASKSKVVGMASVDRSYYLLAAALYIIATTVHVSCSAVNCSHSWRANDFEAFPGMSLKCRSIRKTSLRSRSRCASLCAGTDECRSFNYDSLNGTCELNDVQHFDYPDDFVPTEGHVHYSRTFASSSCATQVSPRSVILTDKILFSNHRLDILS